MAEGTTSADVITTQSVGRGDELTVHSPVHRSGGDVGAKPAELGHRLGARLPEAGSRGLSEPGTAIDNTQYGRHPLVYTLLYEAFDFMLWAYSYLTY